MKMETQEILNAETGTIEAEKLTPKDVKIVGIRVEKIEIKGKEKQKVVVIVKHPDREENIEISSVKFEKNGKLQTNGLWVSMDKDNHIAKGSALAIFKDTNGAKTLKELEGKDAKTTEDERGYLCFKAY
jgi:hypothetical protein